MYWFELFIQLLTKEAIGEANAIKNTEIARRLGLGQVLGGFDGTRSPTSRTVSDLVAYGRSLGYPIVSGRKGIVLAATEAELRAGAARLNTISTTFAEQAEFLQAAKPMQEWTSPLAPASRFDLSC